MRFQHAVDEPVDVDLLPSRLGGLERADRRADGVGIEDRDRRTAIAAGGVLLEIDGRAAGGAADRADGREEARPLGRRERPDEVLFAEKLDEGREAAVAARAPVVEEVRRVLKVVRERQRQRAARAGQPGRQRAARRRLRGADRLEQLERRPRRQLRALEGVEPEGLAVSAEVDREFTVELPRKAQRLASPLRSPGTASACAARGRRRRVRARAGRTCRTCARRRSRGRP